eukprot:1188421-Prymnesium_polylepis.1
MAAVAAPGLASTDDGAPTATTTLPLVATPPPLVAAPPRTPRSTRALTLAALEGTRGPPQNGRLDGESRLDLCRLCRWHV